MKPFRAALLAAAVATVWSGPPVVVTQVALRTTTGTQDITVPGMGTPKAARFIANYAAAGDNPGNGALGSVGATDGTNHFVSAWSASSGATHLGQTYRRGATNAILMLLAWQNGNADYRAGFVQWIPNGVRINVTANAGARPVTITVEFFGGADLSAKVGTTPLAVQDGTTVVTGMGFQSDAILFDSHINAFTDTATVVAIFTSGVASYDGSTIRQAMHYYRSENTGTTNVRGIVRDAAVWGLDSRYAELSAVGSDGFTLTSRGGNLSTFATGYLALNFGGVQQAWVGVLDSPTTTGNKDFTGPGFTPQFASMRPTMLSATNGTENQTGEAVWCTNSITAAAQSSSHWRDRDNVVGAAALAKSETATNAVTMSDHAGTAAFTATYDSFLSNGVRLNFTVANGTVRKWPFLFIG